MLVVTLDSTSEEQEQPDIDLQVPTPPRALVTLSHVDASPTSPINVQDVQGPSMHVCR